MLTLSKKLCTAALAMVLMVAATTTANAQSFRDRLSNKEKVAAIGGGAAAGALIGGLLGGTKGAVIGGLLGAGGGTGYVVYRGNRDDRYGRYDRDDYRLRDYRYNERWRYDHDDRARGWDRYSRERDHRYYNGFRR